MMLIWAWLSVTDMKLASLSTLSCKAKGRLANALQVLPVVDMVSGALILVQLLVPVQHNHVGQLGPKCSPA